MGSSSIGSKGTRGNVVKGSDGEYTFRTWRQAVVWRKVNLTAERVDARSLRVSGLRAAGLTAIAASETLELTFPAGKTTATIEVVNQKVESIPRPPGPQ